MMFQPGTTYSITVHDAWTYYSPYYSVDSETGQKELVGYARCGPDTSSSRDWTCANLVKISLGAPHSVSFTTAPAEEFYAK